jgi:hypoxanthine phosphoribosyltransferase
MMVCKIIYYFERRSRIKNGIRNDYSSWHAAEHVGLYLLFKARTEVEFSLSLYAIIFFIFITLIGIFLHLINRILEYNLFTRAPSWVMENPDLKSILENKLNRNKYSLKYRNYVMKPWTSHLKLEFVTWTKIQTVCNEILKNVDANDYDIVVGISTGGSFVGAYIAKELKKPYSIIHSKFWSGINFKQNFVQTMLYVFGVEQRSKMGDLPDVKGKRVLLVDDTSYTGITINGIKNTLLEKGEPKSVTTMVMWVRDKNKSTDFYQDTKRVPIIWEWGSEVD